MRNLFIFILAFANTIVTAQTNKLPEYSSLLISSNNFNPEYFEETLRFLINDQRKTNGVEELQSKQILKRAAYDQSSFMSEFDMMEQDDPGIRAMLYGGTKNVAEIVGKTAIKKDGLGLTYLGAAQDLLDRWMNSSQSKEFLLDSKYMFSGISGTMAEDGGKIFVACMYGNQSSFSFDLTDDAKQYISSKSYGLEGFDDKICRKISNAVNLHAWANGLYVDKGTIYLEYPNYKDIKQIVKMADDGLAIDIIQKGQYDCMERNIVDYNRPYKGLIQKIIPGEGMMDNNIATKEQKGRLVLRMGKLPDLTDTIYELNLVIVLKDHICANIKKSYIEIAPMNYTYGAKFIYYNDSKYITDPIIGYEATDQAFKSNMCSRSENKWTMNDQNIWNCLLSSYKLNGITSADEHSTLVLNTDKLVAAGVVPNEMAHQLKITAAINALNNPELASNDKSIMLDYLNEQDFKHESKENVLSIVKVLIENEQYRSALKILDPFVKDPSFDEDLLYTHITLSSLFQERIMSKQFVAEIQLAMERNPDRICELLTNKLSFQLFENTNLKDLVCTSCAVDK